MFVWQELNLREDELNKLLNQQKAHEQELQRREEHLRIRELDLIEREINMMIRQQTLVSTKPMPERRKGKFRKSRLKRLLKSGGMTISEPSGQLVTCSAHSTHRLTIIFHVNVGLLDAASTINQQTQVHSENDPLTDE